MEIRTLNLSSKNLEYKNFDFDTSRDFLDVYRADTKNLNHLFVIHPPALDELNDIVELLETKEGYWFLIVLSSDSKYLPEFLNHDNIWVVSKDISNENSPEIKKKFDSFYGFVSKVESAGNIKEIKKLIKKYIDSSPELTPKIEQDIATIKIWQSMGQRDREWKSLACFNDYTSKEIEQLEYFLGK